MSDFNQTIFNKYFYFSTQTHNLLLLSLLAILCFSSTILTYYAILFIKVTGLSTYKYYLLNITTWNTILWINGTILLRKDYPNFIPNTIVVDGVLRGFGSYVALLLKTIEEIALAQLGVAIATCALFKFIQLTFRLVWHTKWVRMGSIYVTIGVHIVSALSIGISSMLSYCPPEAVKAWVMANYPDFILFLQNETVIINMESCQPVAVPIFNNLRIFHNAIVFGSTGVLLVVTTIVLWSQRKSLSNNTLKMLRLQILLLLLHALIPMVGLLLPYILKPLAFLFIIKIDADTRIYMNLITILSTAINNLTTIFVIATYRKRICNYAMDFVKKFLVLNRMKKNVAPSQAFTVSTMYKDAR